MTVVSECSGVVGRVRCRAALLGWLCVGWLAVVLPAVAGETGDVVTGSCKPEDGVAAARIIQSRYDAIRDFSAKFVQVSESIMLGGSALGDADPTRGRVVFAKPGKMRWAYESPSESLVVSDGETLWIYDVAEHTATRARVTGSYLAGAALQFLLGEGRLVESFDIEALSCGTKQVSLELRPRTDAGYEKLGLVADRKSGDILETSVVDLFGNRTRIAFEDTRVDEKPKPELFSFTPPEGVEVIDLRTAPAP